jgi:NAD(P)-dependent dehydrogenase (short-subunit alcohol dehydrogenase family)
VQEIQQAEEQAISLQADVKLTPKRRLAVPQDIANVALFLASSLSSFVTGQCLRICYCFIVVK